MQITTIHTFNRPIRNLSLLFIAWKALLLLVAAGSPGPGYDTSARLSFMDLSGNATLPPVIHHVAERLTRWDAIYFVTVADRGYLFEQEWAFGFGFTRFVALCTASLQSIGVPSYNGLESLVGSSIAHVGHYCSVVLLFKLTRTLFGQTSHVLAFTTATLHIISPAGIFLSAPYAESFCAFLTFAGYLNFAKSFASDGTSSTGRDLLVILAGVMFGAATTFRSNGILSGVLLLEEAFRVTFQLRHGVKFETIRRLLATGIGGLLAAAGFVLPQLIAYLEYCGELGDIVGKRSWCDKRLPSIYTFVQEHYWDVGIFRYWRLSNLPLFLLATPTYIVMILSAVWAVKLDVNNLTTVSTKGDKPEVLSNRTARLLRSFAVPQLLLVLLTLSTAHVQIITRLASAYPVWLWYITTIVRGQGKQHSLSLIRYMVMYAIIQGGLYASFLPPA